MDREWTFEKMVETMRDVDVETRIAKHDLNLI
jgi:hypothetical protein